MRVLALDYDGVIFDSQYEAVITAYNSYRSLNPDNKLFGNREHGCYDLKRIRERYPDKIKEYERLRPYIHSAIDYYVLMHALDKGIRINNNAGFNKLKDALSEKEDEYRKQFYRARKKMQDHSLEGWCRLSVPYPGIIEDIDAFSRKAEVVIVSNNNIETIKRSLALYGIHVKDNDIYDNRLGNDKNKKLEMVRKNIGIEFNHIYFIDDQITSLVRAKQLGVKCFLAVWGYVTEEHMQIARDNDIRLLELEEFSKIV